MERARARRRDRRVARSAALASRSFSTTRITAPSAIRTRSAPSTSTAMTACSPLARRSRRSTAAGAGATASSSGTRPPTRACSTRLPKRRARRGPGLDRQLGRRRAQRRAARAFCSARPKRSACRSTSTACATRTMRCDALRPTRRPLSRLAGRMPAAPEVFARHLATVHVPRRFYVDALPGIPTIRVFEALACGIPLV